MINTTKTAFLILIGMAFNFSTYASEMPVDIAKSQVIEKTVAISSRISELARDIQHMQEDLLSEHSTASMVLNGHSQEYGSALEDLKAAHETFEALKSQLMEVKKLVLSANQKVRAIP
jgi:hypothetical protein